MFANDLHSPIMCIGNGIPVVTCSWREQTSKATMWNDIGLAEWYFNFDNEEDLSRFPSTVLKMASDREMAMGKVRQAQQHVLEGQTQSMRIFADAIPKLNC